MSEEEPRRSIACLKYVFLPPSEVFIAEQLRALQRYEPLVLAVSAPDPMGFPAESIQSLDGLGPVARSWNRLSLTLNRYAPYFAEQIRERRCALIHAQFGVEGLGGLELKRRTGLPLVTSFLGSDATQVPRQKPRVYQKLFAHGDLFLANSQSLVKKLVAMGAPEERVRLLHLGVDLDRIPFQERRPGTDGAVNILHVGRLVEKKGLPYALRAFAAVRLYHHNTTLTIIGDGPDRPAIERLIQELNLSDVRLLGAQPHDVVLREIANAHIFLLPSVTANDGDAEGIPVTLSEAMASGMPVVSTWHAGIPELVADGRCGFLVSERNSHALAERLRNLVEHPEVWGSFGRAGRAIVEKEFSLRRQAATLEAYYDELTATA